MIGWLYKDVIALGIDWDASSVSCKNEKKQGLCQIYRAVSFYSAGEGVYFS